jgi:8-oxo-dGTP diphosphatase
VITFGVIEEGRVYLPRPGAYGLVVRGPELLTIDQNGDIILPGGGIDPGESPEQALVREMLEETGHRVEVGALVCEAREFAYETGYRRHYEKLCGFYRATLGDRVTEPVELDHRMVWLPLHEAARRLSKGSQRWAAERVAEAADQTPR